MTKQRLFSKITNGIYIEVNTHIKYQKKELNIRSTPFFIK